VWTDAADLARSLRDRRSLIFFIDLDHHNSERPGDPFLDPEAVFLQMEPVFRAVRHTLGGYGLTPIILMTGRGYHFAGRIPIDAPVVDPFPGSCRLEPSMLHGPVSAAWWSTRRTSC